ncbi:Beta sliding clamp [Koleobacter methoxysyntrophicus]|uniref:Beta sliding clamp n=1 Tax=Koleobacter methoxysyntrophicus TaxID=2751313 RepID=A0A8A0RSQ1_9FIRM|nr:DNA polymerase III subunit beta [Koleobacter methoxysyntrophicus]QSQ10529.1 Beta sliding clamp [Koleobacter methoxysyntrophicus]
MLVRISKSRLVDALALAGRAAASSSVISVIKGILMEAEDGILKLSGTNLETRLEVVLSGGDVEIKNEGSVIIPASFGDAVKAIDGDPELKIQVEEPTQTVELSDTKGKINFKFAGIRAENFPETNPGSRVADFEIAAEVLEDILKKTVFAAGRKSPKIILEGIKFQSRDGQLKCFALDGYRAAFYFLYSFKSEPFDVIIPASSLLQLQQLTKRGGTFKCRIYENFAAFEHSNNEDGCSATYIVNLLNGNFPKTERLIREKNTTVVKINKTLLLQSLQRASLTRGAVVLEIDKDGSEVKIFSEDKDKTISVSEKIAAEVKGGPLSIYFNSKFLTEPLEAIEDSEVELGFELDVSPCQIDLSSEKRRYAYFAMPLGKE